MTKRFQHVLMDVLPERRPWERLTNEHLARAARLLDERDISDIIGELDALSTEKGEVPDWDGDTQDDIARTQEVLTALLGQLSASHRSVIESQLDAVQPLTRQYLELVLR